MKQSIRYLSVAKHVVEEFSKIDPGSFAFRYPSDKEGKNPLDGITHINVRRLSDYINAFADCMDTASMGISEYLDLKGQMLSEFTG